MLLASMTNSFILYCLANTNCTIQKHGNKSDKLLILDGLSEKKYCLRPHKTMQPNIQRVMWLGMKFAKQLQMAAY